MGSAWECVKHSFKRVGSDLFRRDHPVRGWNLRRQLEGVPEGFNSCVSLIHRQQTIDSRHQTK